MHRAMSTRSSPNMRSRLGSTKIAAEIARRLLAADRATEAWKTIEATEHRRGGWPDFEWEDVRIDVLEALGHCDEAQAVRWSCFERSLSARHLRDYLKRLPEFDDFEAEQRALGYAERYGSLLQAVSFLVSWPSLDRAARTVTGRAKDLDGNHYEILHLRPTPSRLSTHLRRHCC